MAMEQRIENLSNEAYHGEAPYADYISSSQLKNYLKSPKYAKYMMENPAKETDATRLGSLFHSQMEYEARLGRKSEDEINGLWADDFVVFSAPINPSTGKPYGATTKIYKEALANTQRIATEKGKPFSTVEELMTVLQMSTALKDGCGETSKKVRRFLKEAQETEVSYFYENEDGIKLKVRPDLLTRSLLIDWKTTALDSLDEENIAKAIIKYGYHISMAMYQYVLHEITGKWYIPYLVFVTKAEPYDAVIVDLSEWCYAYDTEYEIVTPGVGAMEFLRLLDLHTQCVKSGKWEGASSMIPKENRAILKPSVPAWYERTHTDS